MILSQHEIQTIAQNYFADKPVKRVWLFGSYARGDADDKSDVDFLIDIDEKEKSGWGYYWWFDELSTLLNKKVDMVSSGWENPRIKPFIDKDKKIIYERNIQG